MASCQDVLHEGDETACYELHKKEHQPREDASVDLIDRCELHVYCVTDTVNNEASICPVIVFQMVNRDLGATAIWDLASFGSGESVFLTTHYVLKHRLEGEFRRQYDLIK